MKRFFYLTIAALAFAACAKEITPEPIVVPDDNSTEMVKVKFTASIAQEGDTKADVNLISGEAAWEKNDEIAIFTHNGNLVILKADANGTCVDFSGEVESGDSIDENAIAYYPASIAVSSDNTKVNLPASYGSASAAAKGFILRGLVSGDSIEFKHLGALLKVTINDVPENVTALVLTTGVAVANQLSVNSTNANAPYCAIGSANVNNVITISTLSSERITKASTFLIPLPVGTLTGGLSIALKAAGGNTVSSQTTNNDVTIGRGKLVKMRAYTADGEPSVWHLVGKFNGWNTSETPMNNVINHTGWVVARNITLPNYTGSDQGFKFYKNDNGESWKGGSCDGLHKLISTGGDSNIDFTHNKTYDIYYHPTNDEFFLANAGEPWYRTIYMMTDMNLSTEKTYKLYLWKHDTTDHVSDWPGHTMSDPVTIAGIKYYKFQYEICGGEYPEAASYDAVFNDAPDNATTPTRRYDFRDGKIVIADNDGGDYYVSFTSETYDGNHGENNTNPMTQFTDPANPQGASKWNVFFDDTPHYMKWEGSVLVCKNLLLGPSTDVGFRFIRQERFYRPSAWTSGMTVDLDTSIPVQNQVASRSSSQFKIAELTGNTYCDFYLDIYNNTAKVVSETVTLYFGLPDRNVEHAYLYSWDAFSTPGFPGTEMTEYVTINRVKYYKFNAPVSGLGDKTAHFIVSDGSWQTDDYVENIPSGQKEYYFTIRNKTISYLPRRPKAYNIKIDGDFSDWENLTGTDWATTYNTTTMKAYSDGTHMFIYVKAVQTNDGTLGHGLDDNSQIEFFFDKDNRSDTGSGDWNKTGADDDSNVFRVKLKSNGLRGVLSDAQYNAAIEVVDDTTNKILELEMQFDLTALAYNSTVDCADYIKIYCLGYDKQEFVGNVTVLY